jgi:polyisoprenyl-phosphate glycosyltransferase
LQHLSWIEGSASVPSPASICLLHDDPVVEATVLRLAMNLGHRRPIAAGLSRIAKKRDDIDAVVVMDSDGEDRPEDVMRLCAANEGHPDAVTFAGRASRTESYAFRGGYRIYKVLFRPLTGRSINFGNFSLLPMPVVRRLVFMPELWNNLP